LECVAAQVAFEKARFVKIRNENAQGYGFVWKTSRFQAMGANRVHNLYIPTGAVRFVAQVTGVARAPRGVVVQVEFESKL
jgi:hypothetical protein